MYIQGPKSRIRVDVHDSIVYSLWAVVVFPTIVGFPRYILCLHAVLCFSVFVFRAYIL